MLNNTKLNFNKVNEERSPRNLSKIALIQKTTKNFEFSWLDNELNPEGAVKDFEEGNISKSIERLSFHQLKTSLLCIFDLFVLIFRFLVILFFLKGCKRKERKLVVLLQMILQMKLHEVSHLNTTLEELEGGDDDSCVDEREMVEEEMEERERLELELRRTKETKRRLLRIAKLIQLRHGGVIWEQSDEEEEEKGSDEDEIEIEEQDEIVEKEIEETDVVLFETLTK